MGARSSRRWRRLFAALLFASLVAGPSTAHASARKLDEARALLERARVHYSEGDYEAAAGLFLAAWERHSVPALLFNVAQSFRMSGRQEEARDWYERYISEVPDAPNRREVELRIDQLTRSIERHRSLTPPEQTVHATTPDRAGAFRIVESAQLEESTPASTATQPATTLATSATSDSFATTTSDSRSDEAWWEKGNPPDATIDSSPWLEHLPLVLAGTAAALALGSAASYAVAHASWSDASAMERVRPEVDRRIRDGDSAHVLSLSLGGAAVLAGAGAAITFVF